MSGIYIHIPFCKQKCTYCDFASYPNESGKQEAYFACLYKEIKLRGQTLRDTEFDTLYFGGGTPSFVEPKYILGAIRQVKACFRLNSACETTLEINPGTITKDKLDLYLSEGVNRFSIGMQAADNETLAQINRIHTIEDFRECAKLLKDRNFSVDIMIGLKGQTQTKLKNSIDEAIKSGAKHVSMYALTPEVGTPIYTDYLNGELPDGDEVADLYDFGVSELEKSGFYRYEISNFAQKGFESKHNLNYWARGEYIGFGVSASSFIKNRRFTNTYSIDEYIKCIISNHYPEIDSEMVDGRNAEFEYIMLALRTEKGIDLDDYRIKFGKAFMSEYDKEVCENVDYLDITKTNIRIKKRFMFVQNNVIVNFLKGE